jgi:hypothetical protein
MSSAHVGSALLLGPFQLVRGLKGTMSTRSAALQSKSGQILLEGEYRVLETSEREQLCEPGRTTRAA